MEFTGCLVVDNHMIGKMTDDIVHTLRTLHDDDIIKKATGLTHEDVTRLVVYNRFLNPYVQSFGFDVIKKRMGELDGYLFHQRLSRAYKTISTKSVDIKSFLNTVLEETEELPELTDVGNVAMGSLLGLMKDFINDTERIAPYFTSLFLRDRFVSNFLNDLIEVESVLLRGPNFVVDIIVINRNLFDRYYKSIYSVFKNIINTLPLYDRAVFDPVLLVINDRVKSDLDKSTVYINDSKINTVLDAFLNVNYKTEIAI